MPDRIPQLDDLAQAAEEVPMLQPSEIRRRGDRRRATRQVGVAALAITVVTAIGFGVWSSPLLDGYRNPQIANPPSISPTPVPSPTTTTPSTPAPTPTVPPSAPSEGPTPPPVTATAPVDTLPAPTWANVPTADLLAGVDPAKPAVFQYEGKGQAAKGLCDSGTWDGASTVLVREFSYPGREPYTGYVRYAIVLGYDTVDAATAGYEGIVRAADQCKERLQVAGYLQPEVRNRPEFRYQPEGLPAPARGAYITARATFSGRDDGVFNDTMVIQVGNRVSWTVDMFYGQDNNCSVIPGEVAEQCRLPASARTIAELLART